MAQVTDVDPESQGGGDAPAPRQRRKWPAVVLSIAALLAVALTAGWLARERIADNIIAGQIAKLGLLARYEVESIGTDRQILRNLVIGDPAQPDLTIERVTVATTARWGLPGIGRITLEKPRLYGRWKDGRVSFGSLDPLIYTGSKEPFRLPDLDLALRDGRARIASEIGAMGVKIEGEGRLRDGFSGIVAAILPSGSADNCTATAASVYGKLRVSGEKPRFDGPLRIGALACPDEGLRLGSSAMAIDATFTPALDGAQGTAVLAAGG